MKNVIFRQLILSVVRESGISANEHIAAIESVIGVNLPEGYREFILECGADTLSLIEGSATFESEDGEELSIDQFDGQDGHKNDLVEFFHLTRSRIHPELMPIGRDGFDNLVCLGITGASRGRVYFWYAIGLPGDDVSDDQSSTHFIAPTFESFTEKISFELHPD